MVYNKIKNKPEKFFLITALVSGFLFISLVPPFQAPDEFNHFYKSYAISEGHFSSTKTKDNRLGDTIPESLTELADIFSNVKFNYDSTVSRKDFYRATQIHLNPSKKLFTDFANTAIYSPTAYVPQALAISIFSSIKIPPLWIFYIARVFNLLFWILLVYFSVKNIPYKKWLFAMLALLPSSLFIAGSLSADVTTNGLAFLLISLLIKSIYEEEKEIPLQRLVLIFLISGIISLNKIIYSFLIFTFLLVPAPKFSKYQHKYFIFLGLLLFNGIIVFLWTVHTNSLFIPHDLYNITYRDTQTLNPGVNPNEQLNYVLSHPINFLKITIASYWDSSLATTAHYIGKFGWGRNYLPVPVIGYLGLLILTVSINNDDSNIFPTLLQRLIFVVVTLLMMTGLAFTLYLIWVNVGNGKIHGLSGRYLIPALPLFFLSLKSRFLKIDIKIIIRLVIWGIWLSLMVSCFAVIQRYYF